MSVLPSKQKSVRIPISPFSSLHEYHVDWQTVNRHWDGVKKFIDSIYIKPLTFLNLTKIATRLQLAKFLKGDKKKINYLARIGVLVTHRLVNEKNSMTIYTLGPMGCRVLKKQYAPNWWLDLSVTDVLKQLITNQLYFRIMEFTQARMFKAKPPLTGAVMFNNVDFGVFVVRHGETARGIRWVAPDRMIIICEDVNQIPLIASDVHAPVRYTTDQNLFKSPLSEAFYRWEKGILEVDKVKAFEKAQN